MPRLSRLMAYALSVAIAAIAAPAVAGSPPTDLQQQIYHGRVINPVPLKMGNRDPNSVYLGSYLIIAVATCNSCHSNAEYTAKGNPFDGTPAKPIKEIVNVACFLNGGQSFGPGIVSRNITPDKTGKPAGLTLAQFINVMRTGVDPQDPKTLLQVMPWDGFQGMTDTDLQAMYDYLSSIPSLPDGSATSGPCKSK